MFIVFEMGEYIDGSRTSQLCGTFNDYKTAHALMSGLYHDEIASDEEYVEEFCELRDDHAYVTGENGFPRTMTWFLFDSDNPKQINW